MREEDSRDGDGGYGKKWMDERVRREGREQEVKGR